MEDITNALLMDNYQEGINVTLMQTKTIISDIKRMSDEEDLDEEVISLNI